VQKTFYRKIIIIKIRLKMIKFNCSWMNIEQSSIVQIQMRKNI